MLRDLTDRSAVIAAIEQCDELGRDAFLAKYGFGRSRAYPLRFNGRDYDSKAIAGVAHGIQYPERGALRSSDFSGGNATVRARLGQLGFEVVRLVADDEDLTTAPPTLEIGRAYSWEDLGSLFDVEPGYLARAGGMISRPKIGATLLITHPGGGRSFNYEDSWEGDELIYTGRGQTGDQKLQGQNRDVADNATRLLVFEGAGSRRLRYLGEAVCSEYWWALGEDDSGTLRRILKYRLNFGGALPAPPAEPIPREDPRRRSRAAVMRRPRPFDPARRPKKPKKPVKGVSREESAALLEKAVSSHHDLLCHLQQQLERAGWTEIGEIESAIDLWARSPAGHRVIFEAKTITLANELHQTRAALAQLFEYRYVYGETTDRLCLVTNAPIADARQRLLHSLEISVCVSDGNTLGAQGDANSALDSLLT